MHLVAVRLVLEEAGKNGGKNESRNHGPEIQKRKNVLQVYCAVQIGLPNAQNSASNSYLCQNCSLINDYQAVQRWVVTKLKKSKQPIIATKT